MPKHLHEAMNSSTSKYDWVKGQRGKVLVLVNGAKTSPPTVNLIVGGKETFKSMYKGNFLTGEALQDAIKMFGEKDEPTKPTVSRSKMPKVQETIQKSSKPTEQFKLDL